MQVIFLSGNSKFRLIILFLIVLRSRSGSTGTTTSTTLPCASAALCALYSTTSIPSGIKYAYVYYTRLGLWSLSICFVQSQSLRYNLENQSFPLADHLTEVVEGKTIPNATVQRVATELLQGATANITEATTDMNLLYQRVSVSSPLPVFLQIFDLVEMIR